MDLAIFWTVRCLSTKTIRWMASTCSSVVEVFGWPDQESSSVLSLPHLNSTALNKFLFYVLIDFLRCHTFLVWQLGPLFCWFIDLSHTFHISMGFNCTEIKTEIGISFSSFIRSGRVLLWWKCSALAFLSAWGLEFFQWPLFMRYVPKVLWLKLYLPKQKWTWNKRFSSK